MRALSTLKHTNGRQADVLEAVKGHLNVNLENVPHFVQEEVVLQTLVNLRNTFKYHPHYKNSQELQKEVSIIESFIYFSRPWNNKGVS